MSATDDLLPPAAIVDAGGVVHVQVAVLCERTLWDCITAFMPGYPFPLHTFIQANDPATLFGRQSVDSLPMHLVGHLARDGVLPHLAIAANDLEMLRTIFMLSKHPHYHQRDPKLSFRKAMRCAVLNEMATSRSQPSCARTQFANTHRAFPDHFGIRHAAQQTHTQAMPQAISPDHSGGHEQRKPQVPPPLSICIITIGTQGDVQPFLAVAKRLQQDGHRVRLATHDVYRAFITEHGVEFYPLGGDPKELSSYMVKTGGQLIPLNPKLLFRELPKNMKMVNEICNSTWPAVTAPDPDGGGAPGVPGKPFRAQAIISNPVTYGHVHIAEKLGVPLHIMFPQLWGPTAAFPHPLSSLSYKAITKPAKRNLWSYKVVNLLLWLGSHSTVNDFRTEVLGLRKIRMGGRGRRLLLDLNIPHTFMWSPSLVPQPADYNDRYDVVGSATLKLSDVEESFTPSPELTEFLENTAGDGRGPIFVGFGSMVLKHPEKTTRMIVEAAKLANARVLIQSNWSDMAAGLEIPDSVFFLDYCPHEWLLPRVAAVVHHGGAGTTAAGLRAGKPTFIVPFFGDQHFWARATVTAGVGVEPCSMDDLTVKRLKAAFEELQSPVLVANAHAMGLQMQREDGANAAVQHFYRHLPLESMLCDSDTKSECSHVATKLRVRDQRRLCNECAIAIRISGDDTDSSTSSLSSSLCPQDALVEYQAVNYKTRGPDTALKGALSGSGAFIHELGSGVKDFVAKPVRGYRAKGACGAAAGLARACGGVVMRPLHGTALLADHIATGHCNSRRLGDKMEAKRETVLLGPGGKLAAVEWLCCGS